jgi:hypothetical protein
VSSDAETHARASVLLGGAIEAQKHRLKGYEKPYEVFAIETVRAIDFVFCGELFPEPEAGSGLSRAEAQIMTWGVNGALSRVFPDALHDGPFALFPSTIATQKKANDFLFDCGALALAERQAAFLRDGLLWASIDHRRMNDMDILVLTAADPSLYSEAVGRAGIRWASTQTMLADRKQEEALEDRHRKILPLLDKQMAAVSRDAPIHEPLPEIVR